MNEPQVVADFADLVGEGPVWDADSGALYWTDWVGQKFCRLSWPSRKSEVLRTRIEITGFAVNRAGGFVVANTEGIWLWDGKENMDLIATEVNGRACRMMMQPLIRRGVFWLDRSSTMRAASIRWAA
jgi:D-xylonolactonase